MEEEVDFCDFVLVWRRYWKNQDFLSFFLVIGHGRFATFLVHLFISISSLFIALNRNGGLHLRGPCFKVVVLITSSVMGGVMVDVGEVQGGGNGSITAFSFQSSFQSTVI